LEISVYFEPLRLEFEQHADPARAAGMKAYMKNISDYYGIPAPMRKQLLVSFLRKQGLLPAASLEEMIDFAWQQPQREWQYAAMEIAERFASRTGTGFLRLAEKMITQKSWWDTVDCIAANSVGMVFGKHPETCEAQIETWMQSGNMWLQRTCLLFQLHYKINTDKDLLFGLCRRLAGHPDFFIRKAIGWALREYSKTNPGDVVWFVNVTALSNLSRKEALKIVNR
jgi:3-methyladenine DNA glycosylase AlkD